MAQRNMAETPEQAEEAATNERQEKSLRRRFKIAHYASAPGRWFLMGVCRLLGLSFDVQLGEKGALTALDAMEAAYASRQDNIVLAFHNLLLAHERNEAGELVLSEKEMEGATRYIMYVTATSLSEAGTAQLVALMERREARRAEAAKGNTDSNTNKESGDADGPQV